MVGEPFLFRFFPAFLFQLVVTSEMEQLQISDASAPALSALKLSQVNYTGAMCISSSCQCVTIGPVGQESLGESSA